MSPSFVRAVVKPLVALAVVVAIVGAIMIVDGREKGVGIFFVVIGLIDVVVLPLALRKVERESEERQNDGPAVSAGVVVGLAALVVLIVAVRLGDPFMTVAVVVVVGGLTVGVIYEFVQHARSLGR